MDISPKIIYESQTRVVYECVNCGKTKQVSGSHWRRGNARFCSIGCGTSWRNRTKNPMKSEETRRKVSKSVKETHKKMLNGEYVKAPEKIRRDYRRVAFQEKEHLCELCGDSDYGKLEVHHKDGNRENNQIENLMIVCKPCHHLKIHSIITFDLGHSFSLTYKHNITRPEGSETIELIERLESLLKDLKDGRVACKPMTSETGSPYKK